MKGDVVLRYIGSKNDLIPYIDNLVNKHTSSSDKIFLDLFAGTNVVGEHFKNKFTVYSNDFLYFSFVNAKAIIENNINLTFEKLKKEGIYSPLDYLQNGANEYIKSGAIGYYEKSYSPTGEAMYFTKENAKRIDFIRDTIELWKTDNLITEIEYFYLLSILIKAIPSVSNTTGTYGAYLKHWDKRALKPLELMPLLVKNNHRNNVSYNEDSNKLIHNISADVVYIDTPYNSRQYAANYHILENIARNNKPKLKGKTRLYDWSSQKSDYSSKTKALKTMNDLIENIDATHIIVSYNNEGIISEENLIEIMRKNSLDGNVEIIKIPYRKYKSKVPSKNNNLYEMLIYIQKKEIFKSSQSISETKSTVSTWKCKKKTYIKSPLNYVGGKYKLLNQILPFFPNNINNFIELFSGGANVGINVKAKKYLFNDMNVKINEMFRYFSLMDSEKAIALVKSRIKCNNLSKTNEEAYLKFRDKYNKNPNPLDLYVLSSYSYNYQFRFNNSMEFNNPFGRNRSHFSENMEHNLKRFINRIQELDAKFTDYYFDEVNLDFLTENDFVYLDPPYLITTGSYNDGNRGFKDWNLEEEVKLYKLMHYLTEKSIRYALSNVLEHKGKSNDSLKKFIKQENVKVNILDYNYKHSSYNTKSQDSIEVLITNYDTTTFKLL